MQIIKGSALQTLGRTHTGVGEKCEKEGAAERSSYRLTTAPHPHPPVGPRVGREADDSGMNEGLKMSLGQRARGWRKHIVLICFCFSLRKFIFIGSKLIFFLI